MQKEKIRKNEITLLGITTKTSNKKEMDPNTAKIGATIQEYYSKHYADKMNGRINPGVTYSVYTNYETDEHGEYTYFFGEEITADTKQDQTSLEVLTIPASSYQKFTTEAGKMPAIVIHAWQKIWQMNAQDLAGKRKYAADFEIYDARAADPNNAVVDIYIGIED